MCPRCRLTAVHQVEIMRHSTSTGGNPKIDRCAVVPCSPPIPSSARIRSTNFTKNAALPPPHRFASVSTSGFASYRASLLSPRHRFSRTGLATARLMTRQNSSIPRNRIRLGARPAPTTCHQPRTSTPAVRTTGMMARVPRGPKRAAAAAPAPLAWRRKTTTLLAMLMRARKAVSVSVCPKRPVAAVPAAAAAAPTTRLRSATSSARWKDSRTFVEA
mmetsp:Transcript_25829/g.51438  ORF Transcript_25829/g.51438 Transcript_25829/m.51438 type:complete len:217 (+) Transcript_25829:153-803(+)